MSPLARPIRAISILLALCVIFAFLARDFKVGESDGRNNTVFSVRFQYFGTDAREMERLITIPLEERISGISGLYEMRSVSEYSLSETTVYFPKDADGKKIYLELRDAVDTLYGSLPRAVQKPRIFSSASDQYPMLSISAYSASLGVNELRELTERTLKKDLESLDGVSEVVVSGGSIEEIKVEFDTGRAIIGKINPQTIGSVIRDANVVNPGAVIRHPERDEHLYFDTRIRGIREIGELPMTAGEGITKLSYLASVKKDGRSRDEIVRIDGRECVVLSVKNSSDVSKMTVSASCARTLEKYRGGSVEYTVLNDDGKIVNTLLRQIAWALLQSFMLVIAILPFFIDSSRSVLIAIVLLPISLLMTVGSLNFMGVTIDQNILSGFSIALGLVVDPALVIVALRQSAGNRIAFESRLPSLIPSLVSSTVTTVFSLVPLYFLDFLVPGIRSISLSVAIMLVVSLLLSCMFTPCFLDFGKKISTVPFREISGSVKRFFVRMLYRIAVPALKSRRVAPAVYVALMIIPFIAFSVSGKNISMAIQTDTLPVYVEFPSETAPDSIDEELKSLVQRIRETTGVEFVRTEAKKGVMELSVKFDPAIVSRKKLATSVGSYSEYASGGFLYVPDLEAVKGALSTEISVAVLGDETEKCRSIAEETSRVLSSRPGVGQVVLNFKDPERTVSFRPDRAIIAKAGLSVADVANTSRWMLFGPVVDKWLQNGSEMDIRVSGLALQDTTADGFRNLVIPAKNGGLRIGAIGSVTEERDVGKIYRKDGRRAAYLTATVGSRSTDGAIAIVRSALSEVKLPRGYAFSLARELDLLRGQFSVLLFSFVGCIVGMLILLTALTESPAKSLAIVSIIPVSVAFPLAIRLATLEPLTMGDIVGMVLLSGISVKNAIYITEARCVRALAKVREKFLPILITSLTSLAGALPLLVFGTDGFSRSLAFFMFWGSIGSLIVSVTVFPSVLAAVERRLGNGEI